MTMAMAKACATTSAYAPPLIVLLLRSSRGGKSTALQALLPGSEDTFLVIPYGLLWSEVTAGNLLTVQACTDGTAKVLCGQVCPATALILASLCDGPRYNVCPAPRCQVHCLSQLAVQGKVEDTAFW